MKIINLLKFLASSAIVSIPFVSASDEFTGVCKGLKGIANECGVKNDGKELYVFGGKLNQSAIKAMGSSSKIEKLTFYNVSFEKNLDYSALKNIKTLEIRDDVILDKNLFSGLKNLKKIEIKDYVDITQSQINAMTNLSKLEEIDFCFRSKNALDLTSLNKLKNIKSFNLCLEDDMTIKNLSKLTQLSTEYVDNSILKEIGTLSGLKDLTLTVTEKDIDYSPLKKLEHLQTLNIEGLNEKHSHEKDLNKNILRNVNKANIKKLSFERLNFLQSDIDDLNGFTGVEELFFSLCYLKNDDPIDFKNVKNLTKLTSFTFEFGELKEIPKFVLNSKNLKKLEINGANLTTIPSELGNLKNLEHIDLRGNEINSELPQSLNNLTKLKYLDVSYNKQIRGKTLTNSSLETCDYEGDNNLCIAKDMKCLTSEVKSSLKKCSNSDDSNISKDGKCGPKNGNTKCPSDKCCSKYGYCGKTDAHCGTGCQSEFGKCQSSSKDKPVSTDGKCGPKNGNTVCPSDKCCSKYGYCGKTDAHCGSGCQSEFGKCK